MNPTTDTMGSTPVLRASGVAGIASAVLILGGTLLSSKGMPSPGADASTWSRWAQSNERAIETGFYYLLVPGLLLFLVMMAALAAVQSDSRVSARLGSWGGLLFVVLMSDSAVSSSTTASTIGFFDAFEDPNAVTVLTGVSAGFHLSVIAGWSLAMTMAATGFGLRASGLISGRLRTASLVLAGLTVAVSELGAGLPLVLLWILFISVKLLRSAGMPAPSAAPS